MVRGLGGVVLVVAVGVAAAGCLPAYEADSLLRDGTGAPDARGRRLGCLDVRVGMIDDAAVDNSWPVVGLDMGNRCNAPVYVDLGRVVVTGTLADGRVVRMRAFDPRNEIDAAVLDGRARAREVIAYVPPATEYGVAYAREVCVDVGGITDADPTPPVCFDDREGT